MAKPRAAGNLRSEPDLGLAAEPGALRKRALLLWPRLNRRSLGRIGEEPLKIAALVARRTNLSVETILVMIRRPDRVGRRDGSDAE